MSEAIPVTLKLYASLGSYLPDGAERNMAGVAVPAGTTIATLLDAHKVPPALCHLVLLNGVFQPPSVRGSKVLSAGDAVAVWPPVAGG
ncbi:MAG: MoaD/ThiS family protein [Hyphomicrobiaceae bacterium]|nr:MoaD/ThiS family protein [Hyphomicrobiaceae bacterium]